MIDTRPFELVSSVVLLLVLPILAFVPASLLASMALLLTPRGYGALGASFGGCSGFACGLVALVPLLWLFRWTRTGQAGSFLDEVSTQTGGEVSTGSLLLPMLSPRITGELHGRSFKLTLRRQAGFLSPSRVGGRFLIFGWFYAVEVDAPIGAKIGFAPEKTSDLGVGLFGLKGPAETTEGLKLWPGSSPRGQALAALPRARDIARRIVGFGAPAGSLVRAGPDRIAMSGMLSTDVTATTVAALLEDLASLAAELCEARVAE